MPVNKSPGNKSPFPLSGDQKSSNKSLEIKSQENVRHFLNLTPRMLIEGIFLSVKSKHSLARQKFQLFFGCCLDLDFF